MDVEIYVTFFLMKNLAGYENHPIAVIHKIGEGFDPSIEANHSVDKEEIVIFP